MTTCQAQDMDAAFFENARDPVPPCHAEAEVEVHGYKLCVRCFQALEELAAFGEAVIRQLGEESPRG